MKILIIGPESIENNLLIKAARKRKHVVKRVSIKDLTVILKKDSFVIYDQNKDIAQHDVCLIRGIHPYFAKAQTVALYLNSHGVKVIDRELYNRVYTFDKIFMHRQLSEGGVVCPDTYFFSRLKDYQLSKHKFSFPVILKDVCGMHGRNIYFKENKADFLKFFSRRKIGKFFIQQLIDADFYYRVLVVGDQVLGNMKRCTLKYLKTNPLEVSKRSTFEPLNLALKKVGIRAARATNADIAGVDVVIDRQGKSYVLEVNRSPNFKRFTSVMGVDVASEIIKYLEKVK